MIRGARYAYAALAWAFVVGILVQVFFIGMGLFVKPQNFDLHVNFGWLLHLGPLLILVAAATASAGRPRILQATALAVIFFIVPILAGIRADSPWAAAFHPVGALLGFWLATVIGRGATTLVRSTDPEARTKVGDWVLVALVVLVILVLSFSGSPDA
jgi:hypothetical protein